MIHRGSKTESIVRASPYSLKHVALIIGINRNTLYNWFSLPDLQEHKIKQIGRAIEHDFSVDFPFLFDEHYKNPDAPEHISEGACRKELTELYKKYSELMEKHMVLKDEFMKAERGTESNEFPVSQSA